MGNQLLEAFKKTGKVKQAQISNAEFYFKSLEKKEKAKKRIVKIAREAKSHQEFIRRVSPIVERFGGLHKQELEIICCKIYSDK